MGKGYPWPRVVVLGGVLLAVGFLWGLWEASAAYGVEPTEWALENAWPRKERPYVLLFTDPLCPFCQRLEEALAADPGMKARVRYLPVANGQGSYETWLLWLRKWGWDEEEARRWLVRGLVEAKRSGVKVTPTAVAVGEGRRVVVVGFPSYSTWKEKVQNAFGH